MIVDHGKLSSEEKVILMQEVLFLLSNACFARQYGIIA